MTQIPLTTLEARFVRLTGEGRWRTVDRLDEADGLLFLCPACFGKNGGSAGTHVVVCWFVDKVPVATSPGPGRWGFFGTDLHDLSLLPSIQLQGGCEWHGFVRHGQAEYV